MIGRFSLPDGGQTARQSEGAEITAGGFGPSPATLRPSTLSLGRQGSENRNSLPEFRRALDESDPVEATQRFAAALQTIAATELAGAAKALWARPGDSREMSERKRLLGYRWGQLAGSQAVEFAQAQAGQGKVTAISAALAGWASADPGAAKEWIDGQADPRIRQLYDMALVDGWARHDLAGATEHVMGLSDQSNNERMMKLVAGEHVRQDAARAGSWALDLPEGTMRATAIEEVATRWVWADPSSAIAWVAGLLEAGQRSSTMDTAMGIWTRTDPTAASEYLTNMTEGIAKDQALAAFSEAAAPEYPAASAAWAATISDAGLREESLIAVARTWLRREPEAAQAWLGQSELTEEARARVTE